MKPSQKVREIIALYDTYDWCRGEMAQTADGHRTCPNHSDAASLCVYGAALLAEMRAQGKESVGSVRVEPEIWNTLRDVVRGSPIRWNDHVATSRRDVVSALERVAKTLEARGR